MIRPLRERHRWLVPLLALLVFLVLGVAFLHGAGMAR
jgi:hypothetical protein